MPAGAIDIETKVTVKNLEQSQVKAIDAQLVEIGRYIYLFINAHVPGQENEYTEDLLANIKFFAEAITAITEFSDVLTKLQLEIGDIFISAGIIGGLFHFDEAPVPGIQRKRSTQRLTKNSAQFLTSMSGQFIKKGIYSADLIPKISLSLSEVAIDPQ